MSFYPMIIPMGFASGGSLGWKGLIGMLSFMGGMLAMLVNLLIQIVVNPYGEMNPTLFGLIFACGSLFGFTIAFNSCKDEIAEWYKEKVSTSTRLTKLEVIIPTVFLNGSILLILIFGIPFAINSALSIDHVTISDLPEELQSKVSQVIQTSKDVAYFFIPLIINSMLGIYFGFRYFIYRSKMVSKQQNPNEVKHE